MGWCYRHLIKATLSGRPCFTKYPIMKKSENIIIVEDNDISLFVTQSFLAPFENSYIISYFTSAEETMNFLSSFPLAKGTSISMFVDIGIILNNQEFIASAREILLTSSSRLFLLSSMPVADERMKEYQDSGFLCCIEKPLSEQKFLHALTIQRPKARV